MIYNGEVKIDIYGLNDNELQTIYRGTENYWVSKFDFSSLNQWIIDNVADYKDFTYTLKVANDLSIPIKKNQSSTTFDNSYVSGYVSPNTYLEILNEVNDNNGYSVKTYELIKINEFEEESLVANLNINFTFLSTTQEKIEPPLDPSWLPIINQSDIGYSYCVGERIDWIPYQVPVIDWLKTPDEVKAFNQLMIQITPSDTRIISLQKPDTDEWVFEIPLKYQGNLYYLLADFTFYKPGLHKFQLFAQGITGISVEKLKIWGRTV